MSVDAPTRQSSLSAAQLRQRYIVALSLIALLTIISQIVVQYLIADQEHDSRVINIAGRQRMLSQKITKTALYLTQANSASESASFSKQLKDALGLWQRSHRGLLNGDVEFGLPGQNSKLTIALFDKIAQPHQSMIVAAEALLSDNGDPTQRMQHLAVLRINEPLFLEGMNAIVFQYDSEAKHKVAVARWLELGLMVVTLLVLLLEARFIFAPATQRIQEDVAALEHSNDELKDLNARLAHAQNQLLEADKMAAIGQLAAGVAHEINTPIGYINSNMGSLRGYSEQLLALIAAYDRQYATLPADDPRRLALAEARQAADLDYLQSDMISLINESQAGLDRIRKIVLDLKSFSHINQAEQTEIDLNVSLDSILNIVMSEVGPKIEVVKNYANLPGVPCVAAQINQVLMNLLVNATQAITEQGTITLSTDFDENGIWADITDTGHGIPRDVLKRIFDPFYTTKPIGKGTGLGLSISWDVVVNHHGGRLEVYTQENVGTRFRIWLPRIARRQADDTQEG